MTSEQRNLSYTRWVDNPDPYYISVPVHGSSVVTCLLLSNGRVISASDDHSIQVSSLETGKRLHSLVGHDGGIWTLAVKDDTLVSGSTDGTVRIWDLATGKCLHVFGGHTGTVRCMALVNPECADVERTGEMGTSQKGPKRPLIVTGSRDRSLRVWSLPGPGDVEYKYPTDNDNEMSGDNRDSLTLQNPYHHHHLEGHGDAVRDVAAQGRIAVSGSYDCTVRVWDIITGECKWILSGHTQKVYTVALDANCLRAYSGAMDNTIRAWNIQTGEQLHVLSGHVSLVGLIRLSPSYLVSASADSTIRVWNPDTGKLRNTLARHYGAITCFQHDEVKVLSGSDGSLKMWNIENGTEVRELLTGVTGVWQVVFEGQSCVAATSRNDMTFLNIWNFGNEGEAA